MELTPNYWLVGAYATADSLLDVGAPRFFIAAPDYDDGTPRFSTGTF